MLSTASQERNNIMESFVTFILGFIAGFWLGIVLIGSASERMAIKHNAAYYNSTNAVFTWKE